MNNIRIFANKHKFKILSFCAIFFLVYLLYIHTASFGFIYLDDNSLIIDRTEQMEQPSEIKNILFKPVFEDSINRFYRPVLNLSILIDTLICGGESGYYHYSNILIHISAVFLLFLFLKELKYTHTASFTAAFLFAVHPALASAVAWIPGRNDSLLAVFLLSSFIFFIKILETGKISYFLLFAFSFMIALLTKETAIVTPALFFAYVFLYGKKTSLNKKTIIYILLAIALPVLVYAALRASALHGSASYIGIEELINKLLKSSGASIWYFGTIFLTEKIILFPQLKTEPAYLIKGFFPLAAVTVLCFRFRKKINFKHILFGMIWFVLFISPTYAAANNVYHTHRLYLPMAGILIILIEIASAINKTYPKAKNFFYPIAFILVIFMSASSYKQSLFYESRKTFWFQAYEENPSSPIVNAGVSKYYSALNDFENAQKYMRDAINFQKNSDSSPLISQLALIHFQKGEQEQAKYLYEKALSSGSKYDENAYIGLSQIYLAAGDKENALKIINKGLAVMPGSKKLKSYAGVINGREEENRFVIIMRHAK